MAADSIVAWIAIGAMAGWLAGSIVEGYGFGLIGNIVIGVLGATVAGLLASALHVRLDSTLGNILAATGGAIVLLLAIRSLRRT